VFATATHSKQTIGPQKGCQFFAVCFFARNEKHDAALKTAALHSDLLGATARVLPTGAGVDYDSARRAVEGGSAGWGEESPGDHATPQLCIPECVSHCPNASPRTGRRNRNNEIRITMNPTRDFGRQRITFD